MIYYINLRFIYLLTIRSNLTVNLTRLARISWWWQMTALRQITDANWLHSIQEAPVLAAELYHF